MDDNNGGGGGGTHNHCNIYGYQKWLPLSATSMAFIGCVLFIGVVITTFWIIPGDYNPISFSLFPNNNASATPNPINTIQIVFPNPPPHQNSPPPPPPPTHPIKPFTCSSSNFTAATTCNPPTSSTPPPLQSRNPTCPDYFRWIHEDLKPWKSTGISRQAVELANRTATFRLVILDGRAYVEAFHRSFQTRDLFTMWGVLQLLRRYPGRMPDLDLMFDCGDMPVVKSSDYRHQSPPPPLFQYCSDESSLALVFPDWSFWGWVEINIKPWEGLMKELKEGNERLGWLDRIPYAYWKGNPSVASTRWDLLRCNVSNAQDWNARLYAQDWGRETQQGFKQSNLANQCDHRYKIYIEGRAWSVSEKYILACDSPTLLVNSRYYDFFTRGLMPGHHYWPIRDDNKCRAIKFAVDWGNTHKEEAQAIGKAGSSFTKEELKMDYVYDYMFHLLREYAKLMRYKPTKPPKAKEICVESMACTAKGREREYMMASMENTSYDLGPCDLPPPYDPMALKSLLKRKTMFIEQVQLSEQKA